MLHFPRFVCSSYAIALGINVNITLLLSDHWTHAFGNWQLYGKKQKQNYSAGIFGFHGHCPVKKNWNRTHRNQLRLFIFVGLAMIANGFLDSKILLFFIMAVLIVIPYAYSFFLFKRNMMYTFGTCLCKRNKGIL